MMRPPAAATDAEADDADAAERRLHVAPCSRLLELAHADDEFSEAERAHVRESLRRHLDLDERACCGPPPTMRHAITFVACPD